MAFLNILFMLTHREVIDNVYNHDWDNAEYILVAMQTPTHE